jgi:hypothetical protein
MISDVSKYVDFLTEHEITEHQFLILWLVHTKDVKNIAKYKNKFKEFDTKAVIDLIDRGWIDDFGLVKDGKRSYNIYDFIVTDTFTKAIIVDEEDAYEELRKVYPKWFTINGRKAPAAGGDPLKIAKMYHACHKGNRLEHLRIVEITRKYHEIHKDPLVKIEVYIANKMWNDLEEDSQGSKDAFSSM